MKKKDSRSKYYILFIDDEEKSVKYFQKLFGQYFNVVATTDPQEVLKIIDSRSNEIAVVVSDQKMPNASGVDLLTSIKEKNCNIVRILTTAYASLENNIEAINKSNVFAYLSKPWNIEEAISIFSRALEEFEAKQNYLGLSGSIAHEMRNPLSNVRQSTKFVKERLTTAHLNERYCGKDEEKVTPLTKQDFQEIVTYVDMADTSAKRGNAIIDIILNNINGKGIDANTFTDILVSSFIKQVITEYTFKDGEKERVTFDIKVEQDFTFRGEETSAIYIFFNLLKNSLYYLSSYPNLNIDIRLEIGTDNFNRIYIKDNGPGIPKNKLNGLFEAFATSGKREGTGLGLSFCRRSMRGFGGDILCNSEEGQFTEFVLEFPKISTAVSEKTAINRILLVDDQETNLLLLKTLLEKKLHSISCDKAMDGEEAVKMVKNNRYNIILMDIEMPKMNGIIAVKEIRKFNQDTPIIACSSKDLESVIEDLKNSGFNGYVAKTSSHSVLLKMVSKWGVLKLIEAVSEKNYITDSLRKKKVLLADDEESNLLITAKYLISHQADVDKARDGIEALEKAKSNNYDLILMDIQMPNIDGIVAIEEIRRFQQENGLKRNPIIAITGDNGAKQIHKILNAGFDDYFIKGNDYDDLSNIMAFWSNLKDDPKDISVSIPTSLKIDA